LEGEAALESSVNEQKSQVNDNTLNSKVPEDLIGVDLSTSSVSFSLYLSLYYPVALTPFPYSDKDRIEG
jgi:hypothetical protein